LESEALACPLTGPTGSLFPNKNPPAYTTYKALAKIAAANGAIQYAK
jgi:hypothetical protein